MTVEEANADPSHLAFELSEEERGHTADELWEEAIGEFRAMVTAEGDAAWERIVRDYDPGIRAARQIHEAPARN